MNGCSSVSDGGPAIPQTLEDSGYSYHAFVSHSSEDMADVNAMVQKLEEKHFRCFASERDFTPGHSTISEIQRGMEICRKTIILFTPNLLESKWSTFEVIQALENSHSTGRINLIPVLRGVAGEDLPREISHITYIEWGNDEQAFYARLMKALAAPDIPLTASLPAGDVAHGLAWTYYYGYLKLILPGLEERIKKSKWWKDDVSERRIICKMFILMPESCFTPDSLTQADPRIILDGNLETTYASRAGKMNRPYVNNVYKIDAGGGEVYYVVVEFATPLLSLYEMEQGQLAGLPPDKRLHQFKMFGEKLRDILFSPHSKECHYLYKLVPYDDETGEGRKLGEYPVSELLLKTIVEELKHLKSKTKSPSK